MEKYDKGNVYISLSQRKNVKKITFSKWADWRDSCVVGSKSLEGNTRGVL